MDKLNKGLKETTQSIEKLGDNLDKIDVKVNTLSISAKDVAEMCKKGLDDMMEYTVLQTAKIGAIVTELNAIAGQAIDKNIKEGEKLAQEMEKSGGDTISSLKLQAVKASEIMEGWISKLTNSSDEQSVKLAKQIEENKKLLGDALDEINKKYDKKDIGIFNLKAHKENVEGHVGELKKYKAELEAATWHTRTQYELMSLHYDKDSKEFKKIQEEKAKALEALQTKTVEVDKQIEKSNSSYLAIWKNQHKEIGEDLTKSSDKIADKIGKQTKKVSDVISEYDSYTKKIEEQFVKTEKLEKELNQKKYDKKIENLDKELNKVREEVSKKEEEKKQLEKEQADAKKRAQKYQEDIKKIEKYFGENAGKEVATIEEGGDKENINESDIDKKVKSQSGDYSEIGTISDEDRNAAQERIDELKKLAENEEGIAASKKEAIDKTNNDIIDSERKVLLEQMRIEDEKIKLREEKEKKDAEIAAKAQKRKDQLAKIEKIKAKAQLIVNIAEAVGSVAKGVAGAWAYGPFLGPPLAALVAIQGAMQVGTMTAQLKYMEDGGLLKGKRHSQGGMRIQGSNIEVEGGEYVVNRESTNKNLGLIRYINSQRKELKPQDINNFFSTPFPHFPRPEYKSMLESGGQVPSLPMSADVDTQILRAIERINFQPRVSVTDINTVQEQMVKADEWIGI